MGVPSGPAVVLTREAEDNRELSWALRGRGVPVCEIPCVSTRYLRPSPLPDGPVDAVCFTSRRGVRGMVRQGLVERLIPPSSEAGRRVLVAAVGRATAAELVSSGVDLDLVAEPPEGKVLARMLGKILHPGARITIVRGDLHAGGFDQALKKDGHHLIPVVVYQNQTPEIPVCDPFPVAAVFVASPSAVERLVAKNPWFKVHPFYTIGSTTALAVRKLGVGSVEELGAGIEQWVEALCGAYQRAKGSEKP